MRSFVLILVVSGVVLSAPILNAAETQTEQPPPRKSKTTESNGDQGKSATISDRLPPERESQAPKHQPDSSPSKQQSDDKATPYNVENTLLTIFSLLLTVFTFFLVVFGYRQAKATEVAANAAKASADAALDGVGLTKQQFIATHRPKLIARQIAIKWKDQPVDVLEVAFSVVNVGATRARIVETDFCLWMPKTDNAKPPNLLYGEGRKPCDINLESGEGTLMTYIPVERDQVEYGFAEGFATANEAIHCASCEIYFIGFVVYEDILKTRRSTAFMRKYDFTTKRFSVVDDPDYEYQD